MSGFNTWCASFLNSNGIGTSIYYPHPVPRIKYYKNKYKYNQKNFLNAQKISDDSISVSVSPYLSKANIDYTNAQSKNTMDDNSKQLAVSIDRHFQEWANLTIKATKEGAQLPPHPDYRDVIGMARELLNPTQPPKEQPKVEEPSQEMI